MLTFDYLDVLSDPIVEIFDRYQQAVIEDIARRLANLNYASAAWQVQRLNESSMLYDDIVKKLSRATGKSELELKRIFEKAGVKAMKFDDMIYTRAGMQPIPINLSPAMLDVLAVGYRKTIGTLVNFVSTTALYGQQAFIDAADIAYMQVATGAFSYDQAVKNAVVEVADKGLRVIRYAGREDRIDVAVRRAVLTGVNQTAGMLTGARMDEMGVDLIQTSAHIGARNLGDVPENHEMWQGKIFSRTGQGYPDFYQITGYGTGEGLCGWNCRHSFYPYFEGLSEPAYKEAELESYAEKTTTYNGEVMTWYEATQKQRSIERKIREWKRRAGALEAAGLDNSAEIAKVKQWQARMRDFVKQTGVYRQSERERIYAD